MLFPQFRCLVPTIQRCSLHLSAACPRAASAPKSNLAQLRKKTGYSLSLCKQALEKNENDLAKAQEWLKVKTIHFVALLQ